ncbi:MAG: bifunctional hydroxymethylpyrimidine kinase/phosphomethylpyrimidine kinase, partial [Lentisphaerota bacterium]
MPKPIVWTIAGTDPGGGAGIQGDLTTMNALGVHGCSVITALIAQNTLGVRRCEFVAPDMVQAQLGVLQDDLPPAAIKIGMIGSEAVLPIIAQAVERARVFTVYDPVMISSSGHELMDPCILPMIKAKLLPQVSLITPNIPEAEKLLDRKLQCEADIEQAAIDLMRLGARSVLIKGGHRGGGWSQDYWADGTQRWWITSSRSDATHTHGTGCTLSSALASCRALGLELSDSLVVAKAYINQGIRLGGGIGHGRGPLSHEGWPCDHRDLPWITPHAAEGTNRLVFPPEERLRQHIYPLVDRAAWLEKLLPLGIGVVQLRIKDLTGLA